MYFFRPLKLSLYVRTFCLCPFPLFGHAMSPLMLFERAEIRNGPLTHGQYRLMSCPGQRKRFTVGEIPRVIWAKAIFTPDEISSVAHKVYEPQVVNLHLALQTFAIKSGMRGSKSFLLFLKKRFSEKASLISFSSTSFE